MDVRAYFIQTNSILLLVQKISELFKYYKYLKTQFLPCLLALLLASPNVYYEKNALTFLGVKLQLMVLSVFFFRVFLLCYQIV